MQKKMLCVYGLQHPHQGPQGPATSRSVGALGRGRRTRAAPTARKNARQSGKLTPPAGKFHPEKSAIVQASIRDRSRSRACRKTTFSTRVNIRGWWIVCCRLSYGKCRRIGVYDGCLDRLCFYGGFFGDLMDFRGVGVT